MKIIHVIEQPGLRGGRETYIEQLAALSSETGWKNEFLVDDLEQIAKHADEMTTGDRDQVVLLHTRRAWAEAPRLRGLGRCIGWAHDYSVFSPGGLAWFPRSEANCSLKAGVRCWVKSYSQKCVNRRPDRLLDAWATARKSLSGSKHIEQIIVASEFMRQRLVQAGIPGHKIEVVPYFVNPAFLNNSTDLVEPSPPDAPRVLFVGRLHESKGVHALLEAARHLKSTCELMIVGSGRQEYEERLAELAQQIDRARVGVAFREHVRSIDDLMGLYKSATAVVVPSLWPEPFGIVGLEAMACAKPVVAYDVGGIDEWLVDGTTGWLVPAGDRRELAERIDALVDSPASAEKMGRAGRRRVTERFTWPHHRATIHLLLDPAVHPAT